MESAGVSVQQPPPSLLARLLRRMGVGGEAAAAAEATATQEAPAAAVVAASASAARRSWVEGAVDVHAPWRDEEDEWAVRARQAEVGRELGRRFRRGRGDDQSPSGDDAPTGR